VTSPPTAGDGGLVAIEHSGLGPFGDTAADASAATAPVPGVGAAAGWRSVLRSALRFGRTRVGLAIVTVIVLIAVVGPFVAPYSPDQFVAPPYAPAASHILLGSDYLGRDVLSRFLNGGYVILGISVLAAVLGVGVGSMLGITAGYCRGAIDEGIMRCLDVLLSFPSVVFALLLMSVLGPRLWLIVLAVALSQAPSVARTMRSAAIQLTGREFIAYVEALGIRTRRVVFREILPNVTATLTVELGLRMTYAIAIVASLDFLGFGRQPPAADWGLMINENQGGLTIQPWGVLAPVIAIAVLTIGTNLIADGVGRAAAGIEREVDTAGEA
jgi:peptide/nickel transport system permease protein